MWGARNLIHLLAIAASSLRVLVACWVLLAGASAAAAPGDKVALVIANSQYEQAQALPNPVSDARLIKSALTAVGFKTVVSVQNATRAQMEQAIRNFSVLADQADVALIYYAGHGMELNNVNFLIPVDARLARDRDAEIEAVKLETLLQMTEGAKRMRIIILDACRNNPFDAKMVRSIGTRAVSRGLAPVEPVGESLVVYAAKAGKTAADGSSQNSPFASALARRLVEQGSEINFIFRKVRDDVLQETGGEQEPFIYGSLSSREFYFMPPDLRTAAVRPLDLEAEAWDLCKTGRSRSPCDAYIGRYAKGRFVELAAARVADLDSVLRPTQAPAPAQVASAVFNAESVMDLGIKVRMAGDGSGIAVESVDARGVASGQLFPGDVLVGFYSASPSRCL